MFKVGDHVKTPDTRNNLGYITRIINTDIAVVNRGGTEKTYKFSSLKLVESEFAAGPAEAEIEAKSDLIDEALAKALGNG